MSPLLQKAFNFFGIVTFAIYSTIAFASPNVNRISGKVFHNESIIISGYNFSVKPTPEPVVWDNLEDGACNTSATIGKWASINNLKITKFNQRHSNSIYNAGLNFTSEAWGNFTGGSDSPRWYVQYWFYLASDFNFSSDIHNNLGNIKIFRLWSTGNTSNNLRVQLLSMYTSDLVVEAVDTAHGGYKVGWTPVNKFYKTIDQTLGHAAPREILGGDLGWHFYKTDISTGRWHLFQFEFIESSLNSYDGILKWWYDGNLIVDVDNVRTRTSTHPSSMRPAVVGFYNSHGKGADGNDHFYIDDAYIDNILARVEIGNSSNYNSCTLREIQIPTFWSDKSISVTVNQGAFKTGDTAYIFVIDLDGRKSPGHQIVIGESNNTQYSYLPKVQLNSIIQ
jgi:hypothetical protein